MTNIIQKPFKPVLITAILAAILALVVALTGCTSQAKAADPKASAATTQDQQPATDEATAKDDLTKTFGSVATWDNNISVSVSNPMPYKASEYAAGAVDGQKQVYFEIVLTNHSDEVFQPLIQIDATSGGEDASSIFDIDSAKGNVGSTPTAKLLPGKTIKWLAAYSVADTSDIQVQVSPGIVYDDAIFTNNP